MDRNTIIGLVLIGSILSVFTIFNQPSAEEQAKQQKELAMQKEADKQDKAEDEKDAAKDKEEAVKSAAVASTLIPKLDKKGEQVVTDKGLVYIDTITKKETNASTINNRHLQIPKNKSNTGCLLTLLTLPILFFKSLLHL